MKVSDDIAKASLVKEKFNSEKDTALRIGRL